MDDDTQQDEAATPENGEGEPGRDQVAGDREGQPGYDLDEGEAYEQAEE
jgi:hypothetical protein